MNFFKSTLQVFFGNFFKILLQFIVSIIIARELGPEGKGIYASIIFVPSLLITLGELGITQSIIYHHGRKIFSHQQLFSSVLSLISWLSIILISLTLIVYNTYYKGDFKISWQLVAALQIPISLFLRTSAGFFLGEEKIGVYNRIAWVPALVNLFLTVVLISLLNYGIGGALTAWILSQLIVVVYGIRKLIENVSFNFSDSSYSIVKNLLKTGIIYAISLFIIQANYRIDIFILKKLVSYTEIGYYSIGVSLSEILWQIPSSIGIVILSKTATSYTNAQKYVIAKALRISFLVLLLICIAMYFLIPYFIVFVYGNEFLASAPINRILLIGVLLFTIFKIVNSRFAGINKPYIAIYIFVPCIILKVVGNFLLVPSYGINGAAWASNISYTIGGIAMLIAFSKIENIPLKEILTFKKSDFYEIKHIVSQLKQKIFK